MKRAAAQRNHLNELWTKSRFCKMAKVLTLGRRNRIGSKALTMCVESMRKGKVVLSKSRLVKHVHTVTS